MTLRQDLREAPHRFDFFTVLRELERSYPDKPRIGDSTVPGEDIVFLGQDPFMAFPASNLSAYEDGADGTANLQTRFLGFFGPQGALPLASTAEAYGWALQHDPSFARFTDILANRFQQLFFRAWADARPIAQNDRPALDRFFRYVGTVAGIGSPPYQDRDSLDDIAKVSFAGLVGSKIKSASRLRQLIRGILRVEADVVERVGSWLTFEAEDRMALGRSGSALGGDTCLGLRCYSINDKIRIRIDANDLAQYRMFLPGGELAEKLSDLAFFFLGHRCDFDVELGLSAREAPPVRLGRSGELGWTSWMAPNVPEGGADVVFREARFRPQRRRPD